MSSTVVLFDSKTSAKNTNRGYIFGEHVANDTQLVPLCTQINFKTFSRH